MWRSRGARSHIIITAAPAVLALAACGSGVASSAAPNGAVQAAEASKVVIPGADRFSPFITVVRNGAQVTFHNGDSDAHSVVSIPGDPMSFNHVLEPGETWTVTLNDAGSYRYFCSIHARYDPSTGQVQALPNADHPDEPMEGVVIVSG